MISLASDDQRRAASPIDAPRDHIESVRVGEIVHVDVGGRSVAITLEPPPDVDRAARAATSTQGGASVDLVAPMPGRVIAIHGEPGTLVDAGDPVVTLEAMKMEHVVVAPSAGHIADILVRVGDQVERSTRLAVVEP